MFLGSDPITLAPLTNEVTYLVDGDWAVIEKTDFRIFDSEGNVVARPRHTSMASVDRVTKGDYDHFMPLAAAQAKELAFLISISGAAVSPAWQ